MIIDDFATGDGRSTLGTRWQAFSDRVMGGVSEAAITPAIIDGRRCLRLSGEVRLENNGGFIQMALDLAPAGQPFDASAFRAIALTVRGNDERYGCHLRTSATTRPWMSYRTPFDTGPEWREVVLPFAAFSPHRLEASLQTTDLRRLGLVVPHPPPLAAPPLPHPPFEEGGAGLGDAGPPAATGGFRCAHSPCSVLSRCALPRLVTTRA